MAAVTFYASTVTSDASTLITWVPSSGGLSVAIKSSGGTFANATFTSIGVPNDPSDVLLCSVWKQVSDDTPLTNMMNEDATINSGSILIRRRGLDGSGTLADSGVIQIGNLRWFTGAFSDAGTARNAAEITFPVGSLNNITLNFDATDFTSSTGLTPTVFRTGYLGILASGNVTDTDFRADIDQITLSLDFTNPTSQGGSGGAGTGGFRLRPGRTRVSR